MTHWKRVAVALACVAAVFPAASASARTLHHHTHPAHHHNAHHVRHYARVKHRHQHSSATPTIEQQRSGWLGRTSASGLVARARAFLGETASQLGLPRSYWCADFMNMITGGGTGSRAAKSYLRFPHTTAHVGAIAVLSRGGGGHVGVVSGFDDHGNPIIVSGNHGRAVGEGVYPKHRIIAYVSLRG